MYLNPKIVPAVSAGDGWPGFVWANHLNSLFPEFVITYWLWEYVWGAPQKASGGQNVVGALRPQCRARQQLADMASPKRPLQWTFSRHFNDPKFSDCTLDLVKASGASLGDDMWIHYHVTCIAIYLSDYFVSVVRFFANDWAPSAHLLLSGANFLVHFNFLISPNKWSRLYLYRTLVRFRCDTEERKDKDTAKESQVRSQDPVCD